MILYRALWSPMPMMAGWLRSKEIPLWRKIIFGWFVALVMIAYGIFISAIFITMTFWAIMLSVAFVSAVVGVWF
jgi:hypothetical protein